MLCNGNQHILYMLTIIRFVDSMKLCCHCDENLDFGLLDCDTMVTTVTDETATCIFIVNMKVAGSSKTSSVTNCWTEQCHNSEDDSLQF